MTSIEPIAFRNALGSFATGVTVITTVDAEGKRYGVTANSYNSVSLNPPLILWSLAKTSGSLDAFMHSDSFAVHILGVHQQDLANRFATGGDDKFVGMATRAGTGGVPLFDDCAAHFECRTDNQIDGGDHVIFVGRVVHFENCDRDPLIFHRGRFTRVQPGEQGPV